MILEENCPLTNSDTRIIWLYFEPCIQDILNRLTPLNIICVFGFPTTSTSFLDAPARNNPTHQDFTPIFIATLKGVFGFLDENVIFDR